MKKINMYLLGILILKVTFVMATTTVEPKPEVSSGEYYKYQQETEQKKEELSKKIKDASAALTSCKKGSGKKCFDEMQKYDELIDEWGLKYGSLPETSTQRYCSDKADEYDTDFKECRVAYENFSGKCSSESELGILNNDTLQSAAPFMTMFSGADTILDVYGAMSENPQCKLSKEDFRQERDSIKEQIRDIDDKIKEATDDAQKAQEDYAEKLNEWSDREREILDEMNQIPIEKERNRRKLDDQKTKVKIEAESKYSATLEQINTLSAEYNSVVQDHKAAIYQSSDFAMFDVCLAEYDKRVKANGTSSAPPVANGLSGAYYQGNLKKNDKVNYMANCMRNQRQGAKRVDTAFVNKLNNIKQKIESYNRMLGQIDEERKLADKAINEEIKDLEYDAESKAAKLRAEYQGIQQKRLREEALLKQKLKNLDEEVKKLKQKASVLNMKMQHYMTKSMPTNSDKSVERLISDCNNFDDFKSEFSSMCCDGRYRGKGSGLCKGFTPPSERGRASGKSSKKSK